MRKELLELRREIETIDPRALSPLDRMFLPLLRKSIGAGLSGNYPVASGIFRSRAQRPELIRTNNSFVPYFNSAGHAEMNTLNAWERGSSVAKNTTLIITLEPCLMCLSRISLSRIRQVIFLADDPGGGGLKARHRYPPDFALALKQVKFMKHRGNLQLLNIGNELYRLGEKLWRKKLRTGEV